MWSTEDHEFNTNEKWIIILIFIFLVYIVYINILIIKIAVHWKLPIITFRSVPVFAEDLDEGSNGEVQFSLSGGNTHFSVDPYTGWISTISYLDKETVSSYMLTLTAVDNGTPALSSTSWLYITIIDYNDNPPEFVDGSYSAEGS